MGRLPESVNAEAASRGHTAPAGVTQWTVSIDLVSGAISTAVAHFLHTEGVTGSNPVSPISYFIIIANVATAELCSALLASLLNRCLRSGIDGWSEVASAGSLTTAPAACLRLFRCLPRLPLAAGTPACRTPARSPDAAAAGLPVATQPQADRSTTAAFRSPPFFSALG